VGNFLVGTSSFASPSIRPTLDSTSAAACDLLAAYADRFPAVELDSVFYREPSPDTVAGWINATNDNFTFTVRVPRDVTHVDRLGMPARAARFVESLRQLGTRLGCVLFTTPPSFECDVPRFQAILDVMPQGLRTAWEFRHPSWLCPDVLELLASRGAAPVVVESQDGATSPELTPGGALSERWGFPFVYVRFRREHYTYADLCVWGEILGDVIGEGRDVCAFFRQSAAAASYATALYELLAEAKAATFDSSASNGVAPLANPPLNFELTRQAFR
jgi:uncharacterized protein YecE (DUF72 family)